MKGSRVFLLLVIAIIIATVQHVNKHNEQGDNIDRLAAGLRDVEKCLPRNSSFTFIIPETGIPVGGYMIWRYLLAPRYCSISPKEKFDTVLAICNMNTSDSALYSITANRKVICSSNDGLYKYYLTSNNK